MIKKRTWAALILLSLLAIQGCKKDVCNHPLAFNFNPLGNSAENCVWQPISVDIVFTPYFGPDRISTNAGALPDVYTADNRKIAFDFFGFYFTSLAVKTGEGYLSLGEINSPCHQSIDDAFLFTNENRTYAGQFFPTDDFQIESLKFDIGVDSCRNASLDPTTQNSGPFAPHVPTMYWSWASGYRFVSLEGMVDASAAADGSEMKRFEYHTGLNDLLRGVELPIDEVNSEGNKITFRVRVDFKQVLKDVDFMTEHSTHTFDNLPLALKITENTTEAISLE